MGQELETGNSAHDALVNGGEVIGANASPTVRGQTYLEQFQQMLASWIVLAFQVSEDASLWSRTAIICL